MSLGQISKTGAKVPIAGLNGLSGELVPSVSYYQTGTASIPIINANSYEDTTVTLTNPMPDTDYIVYCVDYSGGGGSRFVFSNVPEAQKTTTSFRVRVFNAGDTNTTDYGFQWYAIKLMTDESRALDEAAIAANTTALATVQSKAVSAIEGGSSKIWIKIENLPYDAEMIVRCRGSDRYLLCTSSSSDKGVSLLRLLSGGTAEYMKIKEGRWDKANAALYVYMESWFNSPTLLPLTNNTDVSSVTYTAVDTSSVPAVDNSSVYNVMGQVALNSATYTDLASTVTLGENITRSGRIFAYTAGAVVNLTVNLVACSTAATGTVTLFTLPSGFTPRDATFGTLRAVDVDGGLKAAPTAINTSGTIVLMNADYPANCRFQGTLTYMRAV